MSDTDDTEKLLLIPPDHFRVSTTDSDNSLDSRSNLVCKKTSREFFVENLNKKVDRLKNSLEKLENVSTSEHSSRHDFVNRSHYANSMPNTPLTRKVNQNVLFHTNEKKTPNLPSQTGHNASLLTNSSGYFHSNRIYCGKHAIDHLNQSLIKTPVGYKGYERGKAFLPVNLQRRFSVSSFESDTVSDCSINSCTVLDQFNMESDTDSLFTTPQKRQDSFMLSEIDAFLDSICKNNDMLNLADESVYLKTPTSNEWLDNKHRSFQSESTKIDFKDKHFPVDPLLKCLKWQKIQIESKESPSSKEGNYSKIIYPKQGSLKSSVPDLGYGMRDIMYPESESVEKPLTQQNISKISCLPHETSTNEINSTLGTFNFKARDPTESVSYFENKETKSNFPDVSKKLKKNLKTTGEKDSPSENISQKMQIDQNSGHQFLFKDFQNETELKNKMVKSNFQNVLEKWNHCKGNKNATESDNLEDKRENPEEKKNSSNNDHSINVKDILSKRSQAIENIDKMEIIYAKQNDVLKSENSIKQFVNSDHQKASLDDAERYANAHDLCNNSEPSFGHLQSLSNMWGEDKDNKLGKKIVSHKFEEEKLRREHCEEIIQQLQKKLLEQHQKLAVALNVDKSKDEALRRLKSALIELTNKVSVTENVHLQQVESLTNQIKNIQQENGDLRMKIDENKSEMAKVIQFAQDCQEKFQIAFADKDKLIACLKADEERLKAALKEKDERFAELKESNKMVVQLNRQISENLSDLQSNLDKMKQDNTIANEKIENLKKVKEELDDELTFIKSERSDLRLIISEEKSRNKHLDTQKSKLQIQADTADKNMKSLEAELELYKQQSEEQKNELKKMYQNQVENIVVSKLNDFQNQLNAAESLMENEMQAKQREIATQFAKQIQKVEQQHKLEIGIIEEKHKEEIKLYRIQLAQCSQSIHQLEDKLSSYKNRRGLIAAQLHSVMENQWQQALRIITNGAPSSENRHLHGVSRIPVEYQHSQDTKSSGLNTVINPNPANAVSSNVSRDFKTNYEQFEKPFKMLPNNPSGDAPLGEDELQRYVKLLLQKTPGVADLEKNVENNLKIKRTEHQNSFQQNEDELPTSDKNIDNCDRKFERHQTKRPWK